MIMNVINVHVNNIITIIILFYALKFFFFLIEKQVVGVIKDERPTML